MKFLLGKKEGMTLVFDESGEVFPVTVIAAGPLEVVRHKTFARDGYAAVCLGYQKVRPALLNKPQRQVGFRHLREQAAVSDDELADWPKGKRVDASVFAEGDRVAISGVTKGKGFQGVVRRHGFAGGPRTHGQKHSEREPGSIGSGLRTRVPKGTRMAGRMGGRRATVKNLEVIKVDKESGRLFVKGAVPGRRGTLLEVRGSEK